MADEIKNIEETEKKTEREPIHYENFKPTDLLLKHKTDETKGESFTVVFPKELVARVPKLDDQGKLIKHPAMKKDGSPALNDKGEQKFYIEHHNYFNMPQGTTVKDEAGKDHDVSGYTIYAKDSFVSKPFNDDTKINLFVPTNNPDSYQALVSPDKTETIKANTQEFIMGLKAQGVNVQEIVPRSKVEKHEKEKAKAPNKDRGKGKERVTSKNGEKSTPEKAQTAPTEVKGR